MNHVCFRGQWWLVLGGVLECSSWTAPLCAHMCLPACIYECKSMCVYYVHVVCIHTPGWMCICIRVFVQTYRVHCIYCHVHVLIYACMFAHECMYCMYALHVCIPCMKYLCPRRKPDDWLHGLMYTFVMLDYGTWDGALYWGNKGSSFVFSDDSCPSISRLQFPAFLHLQGEGVSEGQPCN